MLPCKRFRYSKGHIICLELLQAGFFNTFIELFKLIQISQNKHKQAEATEERDLPPLLENDFCHLNIIAKALIKAEHMSRKDNNVEGYELRLKLGHYFHLQDNYVWIAEHFFLSSCQIISKLVFKDGKKMVYALERLGYIKEQEGELNEALNLLKEAYHLADKYGIEMTDIVRQSLYLITHRIYMSLGEKMLIKELEKKQTHPIDASESEAVKFYKRALDMAELADTVKSRAASHFKIGKVMLSYGNYEAAIEYFRKFLILCEEGDDKHGLCNGYLALSSVYQTIDDTTTAKKLLAQCQEIALKNSFNEILISCCTSLGELETEEKNYKEAHRQFSTAFDVFLQSPQLMQENKTVLKSTRVLLGVGKAHLCFGKFAAVLAAREAGASIKL